MSQDDTERQKFVNFLSHYDLSKYYEAFREIGVTKLAHLKDVSEDDLKQIGLSNPEKTRLLKKYDANFSKMGKLKKKLRGKDSLFDHKDQEDKNGPHDQADFTKDQTAPRKHSPEPSHHGPLIINPKDLEMGKKIGEGAFGSVHEAIYLTNGRVHVAVKMIYVPQRGPSVESMFIKEAQSLSQLNHPHIIKLYGISLGDPLMLVQELAPLGNLHAYLKKGRNRCINMTHLYRYGVQVAHAMDYLENLGVIHRDLATRNILLVSVDHVKLSDFGLARVIQKDSTYKITNMDVALPTAWLSPEALSEGKFSSSSDVWSYGVFFWEIFSLGASPWDGKAPIEILTVVSKGECLSKPKLCPVAYYKIMKSCWHMDPCKRPTFAQLLVSLNEMPPDVVKVTNSHITAEGFDLSEGDKIYFIDRVDDRWSRGMTADGVHVTYLVEHVTEPVTEHVAVTSDRKQPSTVHAAATKPGNNLYVIPQSTMVTDNFLTPEDSIEGYVKMNPALKYRDDIPTKEDVKTPPRDDEGLPIGDLMSHETLPSPTQEAILNALGSSPAPSPNVPARNVSSGHAHTKHIKEDTLVHVASEGHAGHAQHRSHTSPDHQHQPDRPSAPLGKPRNTPSLTEMTRLPTSPTLPGATEMPRRSSAPFVQQLPKKGDGHEHLSPMSHTNYSLAQPYIETPPISSSHALTTPTPTRPCHLAKSKIGVP